MRSRAPCLRTALRFPIRILHAQYKISFLELSLSGFAADLVNTDKWSTAEIETSTLFRYGSSGEDIGMPGV